MVQSGGYLLIFQDIKERFTVCKSKWFGCWNEICSSRIRPINIARVCSQLSQIRGNFHLPLRLSDYDYVSNGEFLKILVFSDRTEKSNFCSCISELENDYGWLFIFNYTPSFLKDCIFINQE